MPCIYRTFVTAALSVVLSGAVCLAHAADTVFTMSNARDGNRILPFTYAANSFTALPGIPTGGLGTGGPLENQSGIALGNGASANYLFVVNAGSDDITAFRIDPAGLTMTSRVPAGGVRPVSLAVKDDRIYVLNGGSAATPSNVSGFRLATEGTLSPIAGSSRPLPGNDDQPAQISFIRGSRFLVVTETSRNMIDVFKVNSDGSLTAGDSFDSSGNGPFGFAVRRDLMFVSELSPSALSSYRLQKNGTLRIVTPSVSVASQFAACWVVLTQRFAGSSFAYISNTGSDTISSFKVNRGRVALLKTVAARTRTAPIDMALDSRSRFLFVLDAVGHTIEAFRINPRSGVLKRRASTDALPVFANGLVVN